MLKSLQDKIRDVSAVRRLAFAAGFLPSSMPAYSTYVAEFSVTHRPSRNYMTTAAVSPAYRKSYSARTFLFAWNVVRPQLRLVGPFTH